jgi:hypothetical protein
VVHKQENHIPKSLGEEIAPIAGMHNYKTFLAVDYRNLSLLLSLAPTPWVQSYQILA